MTPEQLKERSKKFALRILNLAERLPRASKVGFYSNQIARAGTSLAANYRTACKSRSRAEFVADEEADETQFWLELICDCHLISSKRLLNLQREARDLTSIFAASRKSAAAGSTHQLAIESWQLAIHLW